MFILDFFSLSSPLILHQGALSNLIITKIIKKYLKIKLYWHLQNYVIHLHYNEEIKIMHFSCLGCMKSPHGKYNWRSGQTLIFFAFGGS